MSLSIGIVGLPNVGKSTLFETLTKKQVDRQNYPFCTIDPNVGVVAVPDERVEKLTDLTKSVKKVYATAEFVDIAGLVKGANKGEGLGNKFLANIRETDAIIYVLRAFESEKIINTETNIDPLRDKEILDTELMLKDMETIERRFSEAEKEKKSGKKEVLKEIEVLQKSKIALEQGKILSEIGLEDDEKKILKGFQLLSMKPRLYLLNGQDKDVSAEILEKFKTQNADFMVADVISEFEAADMLPEEREALGMQKESELDVLIKKSFDLLGLINFFTTGEDETRAWTIKKGSTAPQAGGVIHSDFEKKFIKADVINWEKLLEAGSFGKAREKGLIRTEGKEYVAQDGDVIEIKHS